MIVYILLVIILTVVDEFLKRKIRETITYAYNSYNYLKNKFAGFLLKYFNIIISIHFIDFQNFNYYDKITIQFPIDNDNYEINMDIKNKIITVPIIYISLKSILDAEISIINSSTKVSKSFKISIYKNYINYINIYLNNKTNKYFGSEIIFYGEINKINIIDFYHNNFGLKKRLRYVIFNIEKNELLKIIQNYNDNKKINVSEILSKIINKNILINIFIGNNISKLLIFTKEYEKIILASEFEKKLFSDFYINTIENINEDNIDINNINTRTKSFIDKLSLEQELFGLNLKEQKVIDIIFSYLNQGINFLLDNNFNIFNENDEKFIFGCLFLILFAWNKKIFKILKNEIKAFKNIITITEKKNFVLIDKVKIVVGYVSFYVRNPYIYDLQITAELAEDDVYKRGFAFYKSVIEDLTEESELILIYLQLNSGAGLELLNQKNCYKISMISIEEIKEHLLEIVPNYFFVYNAENSGDITISDPKTQMIGFNTQMISSSNKNDKNTEAMNVSIGMFHESGHEKYPMSINDEFRIEPVSFISKTYQLINLEDILYNNIENKTIDKIKKIKRRESGICVDTYLYGFSIFPSQILINSNCSYILMNKSYFISNLDELNKISLSIIGDYMKKNNINFDKTLDSNKSGDNSTKNNVDNLKNITKILKIEDNDIFYDEHVMVNA